MSMRDRVRIGRLSIRFLRAAVRFLEWSSGLQRRGTRYGLPYLCVRNRDSIAALEMGLGFVTGSQDKVEDGFEVIERSSKVIGNMRN